jgi:diadenosine tetraphosphatase ApaH/serine/threonine PP2A family protein phosphatase
MRYAILGDIHANLAALEAVLAAVDAERIEQILQVGDVVGYGAAPKEVIEVLRERDVVVVKGNHDAACVGELDARLFNRDARAGVRFTEGQLGRVEIQWLKDLPLVAQTEHCSMAHGTLHRPERFEYVQSIADAEPSLDMMEHPACFVGHTHVPVTIMRMVDDPHRTSYTIESGVDLAESSVALVNVGSVGQPRDDDPRAAYAIYDSETKRVDMFRIDYDIEREADRITRAGLPKMLADRLFLGF